MPQSEVELRYATAEGPNDYAVALIQPAAPVREGKVLTRLDFQNPYMRVLNLQRTLPRDGLGIVVPPGAGPLVAALYDQNFKVPQGVNVTVTKPNGTVLNQSTSIDAPGLVVQTQNGFLTGLVMVQPDPGEWTIQIDDDSNGSEFQFFFSTTPIQDVLQTIETVLPELGDPQVVALLSTASGEGVGRGSAGTSAGVVSDELALGSDCFWCKFGVFALAALVAAALLTLLTVESAVVTAVASFVAASPQFVLNWLGMMIGWAVDQITTAICERIGACGTALTSSIPVVPSAC